MQDSIKNLLRLAVVLSFGGIVLFAGYRTRPTSFLGLTSSRTHQVVVLGSYNQTHNNKHPFFPARRVVCQASVLPKQDSSKSDGGDLYSLVASSHSLDQAVPTNERISLLFHRSSSAAAGADGDPCSPTVLEDADAVLADTLAANNNNVVDQKLGPTQIPLSQSAFFQLYIDHRETGDDMQTRRVVIDVIEVAPSYFYLDTQFVGNSGLAVLSLEVAFESLDQNHTIPLDTLGSDQCGVFNDTEDERVRFRYERVARFGVLVERQPQQNETDNDGLSCDYSNGEGEYSNGEGEWVFELARPESSTRDFLQQPYFPFPSSVLDDIARAPSANAKIARYRLFSCSQAQLGRDFANGKQKLANSRVCSLGDSNFQHMEPFFRSTCPSFETLFTFRVGTTSTWETRPGLSPSRLFPSPKLLDASTARLI